MPSTDPDVLPPHSLCFYQETDQPDKLPGKFEIFQLTLYCSTENRTFITEKICLPPLHSEI